MKQTRNPPTDIPKTANTGNCIDPFQKFEGLDSDIQIEFSKISQNVNVEEDEPDITNIQLTKRDKEMPSLRVYGSKGFKNPFLTGSKPNQASRLMQNRSKGFKNPFVSGPKPNQAPKLMQNRLKVNFKPAWKKSNESDASGKFSQSSCSIVEEGVNSSSRFSDDVLKADSFDRFNIKRDMPEYDMKAGGKCVLIDSGSLKR